MGGELLMVPGLVFLSLWDKLLVSLLGQAG